MASIKGRERERDDSKSNERVSGKSVEETVYVNVLKVLFFALLQIVEGPENNTEGKEDLQVI